MEKGVEEKTLFSMVFLVSSSMVLIMSFTRFAGTPKEILGNEEMMNFFIPLLRADFEMDEKYLRKNKVKLECSINAFCGENDTEATETDMQEWGEYTSDFALEVFAGDHFFIANIKNKEEELTKEVNKELLSEWVHAANKVVLSDIFLLKASRL